MRTDDQSDAIECLAAPSAYDTATIHRIDTHGAMVFLGGSHRRSSRGIQ
jgi:hypothetical protein